VACHLKLAERRVAADSPPKKFINVLIYKNIIFLMLEYTHIYARNDIGFDWINI
jgi:hypothetical protein